MNYFNKNKWWAIAFIVLIALNITTLSVIWLMKGKNGMMLTPRGGAVAFLVKELGFDKNQEQQLWSLNETHQQHVMEIRQNNKQAKDSFFSLLDKTGIADTELQQAAQLATRYDQQLDMLTFRYFQQVRSMCNEQQQKKFDSIIKEVIHRMAPPPPGQNGPPPSGLGRPNDPPPPDGHGPPPQ